MGPLLWLLNMSVECKVFLPWPGSSSQVHTHWKVTSKNAVHSTTRSSWHLGEGQPRAFVLSPCMEDWQQKGSSVAIKAW